MTMRILAIGDIHGRPDWKFILKKETFDKFVITGDYFDSREGLPFELQLKNFNEIIEFKKENPDKAVLLFGNHDFHYTPFCKTKFQGYQLLYENEIKEAFKKAYDEKLFQMCFKHDTLLFSHAGISQTWCRNNSINQSHIDTEINALFYSQPEAFAFRMGENKSPFGDDKEQSPIWIRPKSLLTDMPNGFLQVVGHTQRKKIDLDLNLICIDVLTAVRQYLIVEEGGIGIGDFHFFDK
jgi:predicted phosphodiesterase